MRPLLGDKPPIYQMDIVDALAYIIGALAMGVIVELSLLFIPGFSGFILFMLGVWCARHFGPQIIPRYRLWQKTRDELRVFRMEIEQHEKER